MYSCKIRESVEKTFHKLSRKNPKQLAAIGKKIEEILQNPQHYKNLKTPLQHMKRVHIDSSYVLVFSVDETEKTITIEDYEHHDRIYQT